MSLRWSFKIIEQKFSINIALLPKLRAMRQIAFCTHFTGSRAASPAKSLPMISCMRKGKFGWATAKPGGKRRLLLAEILFNHQDTKARSWSSFSWCLHAFVVKVFAGCFPCNANEKIYPQPHVAQACCLLRLPTGSLRYMKSKLFPRRRPLKRRQAFRFRIIAT